MRSVSPDRATSTARDPAAGSSTVQFIHVGLPKAASTWLQDELFDGHPDLAVLGGRADGELYRRFVREARRLVHASDLSCDAAAFAANVEQLCRGHREARSRDGRAPTVTGMSYEVLSGEWPTGRNARFIAETLAERFPSAKILIVLREQRSMIESTYKEFIRMGGTTTPEQFLLDPNVTDGFVADDQPRNSHTVEFFKFNRLVETYQRLFGPGAVHVDCAERLRDEPQAFADDLTDFLGVARREAPDREANVQLSTASLGILRRLNRLFANPLHRRYGPMPIASLLAATVARRRMSDAESAATNRFALRQRVSEFVRQRLVERVLPLLDRAFLRAVSPKRVYAFDRLPASLRDWLADEYRRDNDALQERIGVDLGRFGYLVSPGLQCAR